MAVLFIDECHLLNGAICGYVWGQTQIRIEVPIKNEKIDMLILGHLTIKHMNLSLKLIQQVTGNQR
jgi:hypothetical protein